MGARGREPQSIGQVGNYFNQELFGAPTSLPWGLATDPDHRPPGYEGFTMFQPSFLYEIVWNLSLAAFLVWLDKRGRVRAPGLFALYVAGYSGFRIYEELVRVDPAHHVFGLRLNLYVATALCVAGPAVVRAHSTARIVEAARSSAARRRSGGARLRVR